MKTFVEIAVRLLIILLIAVVLLALPKLSRWTGAAEGGWELDVEVPLQELNLIQRGRAGGDELPGAAETTAEQTQLAEAQEELRRMGVRYMRLEQDVNGAYVFFCLVDLPGHQAYARPFSASSLSSAEAAENVVFAVKRWLGKHPVDLSNDQRLSRHAPPPHEERGEIVGEPDDRAT